MLGSVGMLCVRGVWGWCVLGGCGDGVCWEGVGMVCVGKCGDVVCWEGVGMLCVGACGGGVLGRVGVVCWGVWGCCVLGGCEGGVLGHLGVVCWGVWRWWNGNERVDRCRWCSTKQLIAKNTYSNSSTCVLCRKSDKYFVKYFQITKKVQ